MNRTHKLLNAFCIVIALAFSLPVRAYEPPQAQAFSPAVNTRVPSAALWRDRGNIESLNLVYGPGGKEHQPGSLRSSKKTSKAPPQSSKL
jgi:hypothetical protein